MKLRGSRAVAPKGSMTYAFTHMRNYLLLLAIGIGALSREGHGWWHFDRNVPIIDWTPRLSNLMIFWTNSTVQFNFSQNLEKRRPYFDKTSNREKLQK